MGEELHGVAVALGVYPCRCSVVKLRVRGGKFLYRFLQLLAYGHELNFNVFATLLPQLSNSGYDSLEDIHIISAAQTVVAAEHYYCGVMYGLTGNCKR